MLQLLVRFRFKPSSNLSGRKHFTTTEYWDYIQVLRHMQQQRVRLSKQTDNSWQLVNINRLHQFSQL